MANLTPQAARHDTFGSYEKPWHLRLRYCLREHQWPLIGLSWLIVLGLGFVGYSKHLAAAEEPMSAWDALYRAIQLFVLEGGRLSEETFWEFEVARFLAPVVTGYTALQGIALLFSEQLDRLWARFAKRHVIVCGLGEKGSHLARGFRDNGWRVIAIESDLGNPNVPLCRERGVTVLGGDAASEEALRSANVRAASYLFAVCGDDGVNAEVATRARFLNAGRASGVLACYAHIVDLALCRLLREQYLAGPPTDAFRLEFFNIYETGSRALLATHPISAPDGEHAHVLVVGMGDLGEGVVLQAAREWREAGGGNPLSITVVDREAETRVDSLLARFPHLAGVCELRPCEIDVRSAAFQSGDFLLDEGAACDVSAAFVCLPSDALNVASALSLFRRCSSVGEGVPIVARVTERGGLQTLLTDCAGVSTFPLLDETCRPELLLRGVNETLAQAMHEDYLRHELAKGRQLGSRPAMRRWDDLPDDFKEANRAQADCLAERLSAFGYRIAPLTDWEAERFEFSAEEIEGMSRMEHERWCAERHRQGWKHGADRDDDRKLHPDLVPWEGLSEEAREKDRVMVRDLPAFLAKAGFQVERVPSAVDPDSPARA